MKRRLIVSLLTLVLFVLAADTAAWWIVTSRLMEGYARWQASLTPRGWQAEDSGAGRSGWPFAALVVLKNARLGQTDPAGFAWSAENVAFGVSIWQPDRILVAPSGAESVAGFGLAPAAFHAESLRVTAPLRPPVSNAAAVARALTIAAPFGKLTIGQADLQLDWSANVARVAVTASGTVLPRTDGWGLGQTVDQAALRIEGDEAWPGGNAHDAAQAWRDAGGKVQVVQAAIHWGALTADAAGDARLDEDLQPEAHLTLHVNDPSAALDALANGGAISRGAALAAGAVLKLLSIPAGGDAIALPVAIKSGSVTLARIPVARVAEAKW